MTPQQAIEVLKNASPDFKDGESRLRHEEALSVLEKATKPKLHTQFDGKYFTAWITVGRKLVATETIGPIEKLIAYAYNHKAKESNG